MKNSYKEKCKNWDKILCKVIFGSPKLIAIKYVYMDQTMSIYVLRIRSKHLNLSFPITTKNENVHDGKCIATCKYFSLRLLNCNYFIINKHFKVMMTMTREKSFEQYLLHAMQCKSF